MGWGSNVSNYLIAIAAGCLQKTGGAFTLSAETDFGASFGLKSLYYKSRAINPAATGAFRLANAETGIVWRNAANSADLALTVNASNQLSFNGTPIESNSLTSAHILVGNVSNIATDVAMSGDIGIDNTGNTTIQSAVVTGAKIASNTITNANINSAAAIAYSKLSLTGSVVNADIATAAAIAITKIANGTANQLIGTNSGASANEFKTLSGTTSQVVVTNGTGTITLSTPQNIDTAATVQFGTLTLGGALDTSSILSLTSTTKGFLPPSMTTTQKNAISTPTNGLVVYDSSLAQLFLRSGGAWTPLSTGGGSGTVSSGTANQLTYYASSGTTVSGLTAITASQALASDTNGLPVASTTTAAELAFVHGVTSAIQTQLGLLAPKASPAFTGTVLLGPAASRTAIGVTFTTELEGTSTATSGLSMVRNSADSGAPSFVLGKTRGAATGSSTTVTNGDGLGNIYFAGADGTNLNNVGASVEVTVAGTVSTGIIPGSMMLRTATSGGTLTTAITIDATQKTTHRGNIAFTTTSTQGIVGTTTNDSAAAGNVGETVLGNTTSLTNFPTSPQWGDLTSISLTAGDWLVWGNVYHQGQGGTTTQFQSAITITAGNSTTGFTNGLNNFSHTPPTGGIGQDSIVVSAVRFSLTGTTTVYLKYNAAYTGTIPQSYGNICALRIR